MMSLPPSQHTTQVLLLTSCLSWLNSQPANTYRQCRHWARSWQRTLAPPTSKKACLLKLGTAYTAQRYMARLQAVQSQHSRHTTAAPSASASASPCSHTHSHGHTHTARKHTCMRLCKHPCTQQSMLHSHCLYPVALTRHKACLARIHCHVHHKRKHTLSDMLGLSSTSLKGLGQIMRGFYILTTPASQSTQSPDNSTALQHCKEIIMLHQQSLLAQSRKNA